MTDATLAIWDDAGERQRDALRGRAGYVGESSNWPGDPVRNGVSHRCTVETHSRPKPATRAVPQTPAC